EWFHEKEYQILNLTYIFDGPFPTFYRGPLQKEEPCVNKLLIEFQKFYELFRY
ncbi:hypothetical protein UAI_01256, partial [Enterococcus malodoratus ATCC 43197]